MAVNSTAAPVRADDGLLTDELLARCAARAPQYDTDNRFFDEDFQDLRDAGYLVEGPYPSALV